MKREITQGFTLIELMVTIAIIALLSIISVTSFMHFLGKAKRAEAYMNLNALCAAQKAYWVEHGTYSTRLSGSDSVSWRPDGYHGGGEQEKFFYTYGFGGSEGVNNFTGKSGVSAGALPHTYADKEGFLAGAVADLNGNGIYDILTVDQNNTIVIAHDGL